MQDIWQVLKNKLPWGPTPEEEALRDQYWAGFDVNKNGYISLAEVDKGMRDVINLPILFDLKPVLIRSFNAAKNKLKSKNSYGDDYVSKAQFKYLLLYLRQHYEYWVAFDKIDKSHDRKISLNEFKEALPLLQKWGIQITDAAATFGQIDKNKGGSILFDEFCGWAIKTHLDIDDDDNAA